MAEAVKHLFGWQQPGFIVTMYVTLSVAEFFGEQIIRILGRTDRMPFMKAGENIASVLVIVSYITMLINIFNGFVSNGTLPK